MSSFDYALYTDGSCIGNPGPGGWAAVLITGHEEEKISGGHPLTTNNRMELMSVIEGLKLVPSNERIAVFSDSKYIVDAFNQKWIYGWRKNGWTRSAGELKNKDLWMELYDLVSVRSVSFFWVKGHDGNKYNEICDQIASQMSLYYQSHSEDQNPRSDCVVETGAVGSQIDFSLFPDEDSSIDSDNNLHQTGVDPSNDFADVERVYAALDHLLGLTYFHNRTRLCGVQPFCDFCTGDLNYPCARAYVKQNASSG